MGSDVYVGGSFSMAGGIAADNIARWSTTTHQWYALGGGISGIVYTMVPRGNYLYVGGSFNDINGTSAWSLASWDTVAQSWSLVGGQPGLSSNGTFVGVVQAMAFDSGGNLYVGGFFDHTGSIAVENIARWDGASWSALGGGLGATSSEGVFALVVSGNDVYAGGFFSTPESNIAHWNGASWSGMGGMNGKVSTLANIGNTLYAGGQFIMAGVTPAQHIAVWTGGTNWQEVGGGTDDEVTAIVPGPYGTYVTGNFQTAGSTSVKYGALWNGSAWLALGYGVDAETFAAAVVGDQVYVGGAFLKSSFRPSNHIAIWYPAANDWLTLGNSVDATIFAMAISGNDVYVGGRFNSAGGVPVNNLAKWNRQTGLWSDVSGGVLGCNGTDVCIPTVWAIAVNGTDVYVGGNFNQAGAYPGQVAVGNLARFDTLTQSWTSGAVNGDCGVACENDVFAIVPDGSGVDVGGSFSTACANPCLTVNNVVYWDGRINYHTFTDGFTVGTNGGVSALLNDGSGLYIGGAFTSPRTNLAYFDGNNWFQPGSTLDTYVAALAEDGQYLYAGGLFTNAGSSGANNIARLPLTGGGDWQPLGGGFNDSVFTLAWSGSDLIAGGKFTQSGLTGLNDIARWNTTAQTWSPLGSGANDMVLTLAASGSEIFAGGWFTTMGGKEAEYFSRWARYYTFLPMLKH
jgi:hypothetical protein